MQSMEAFAKQWKRTTKYKYGKKFFFVDKFERKMQKSHAFRIICNHKKKRSKSVILVNGINKKSEKNNELEQASKAWICFLLVSCD